MVTGYRSFSDVRICRRPSAPERPLWARPDAWRGPSKNGTSGVAIPTPLRSDRQEARESPDETSWCARWYETPSS